MTSAPPHNNPNADGVRDFYEEHVEEERRRNAPPPTTEPNIYNGNTTLLMGNIPNWYSQADLLKEINETNFGTFDFFFLRRDTVVLLINIVRMQCRICLD